MRPKHSRRLASNLLLLLMGISPATFLVSWMWLNWNDGIVRLLPQLPIAFAYDFIVFALPLGMGALAHYALMMAARRFLGMSERPLRVASLTVSLVLTLGAILVVGVRNLNSPVTTILWIIASLAFGVFARIPQPD